MRVATVVRVTDESPSLAGHAVQIYSQKAEASQLRECCVQHGRPSGGAIWRLTAYSLCIPVEVCQNERKAMRCILGDVASTPTREYIHHIEFPGTCATTRQQA